MDVYSRVFDCVVPVSSVRAAEMVKVVENVQRLVNISLANELARICRAEGIDVWEVIDAAATKPYGFTPYYPGPGAGGHCIPVDPLYLKWKANRDGVRTPLIDVAHQINRDMPRVVVDLVAHSVPGGELANKKILVIGAAYKRDVNDARESPALPVIRMLCERGADVCYHDPHVPTLPVGRHILSSVALDADTLRSAECVLILTDHRCVDYREVVRHARLVVDTRNATRGLAGARVVRL